MHHAPDALVRLAPAKINLALHVVGRRSDGYHLLESLVAFTRFGDRVSAKLSEETMLQISGPYGGSLPRDASNLIFRAEHLLRSKLAPQTFEPAWFKLEKNLPVASGIGGGSSDAAAVITLLCRLWGVNLPADELVVLTQKLGADIPMCIEARPLIARGTGEQIELVKLPPLPMVLVNPDTALATPAVFKALKKPDNSPLPPLNHMSDVYGVIQWLRNTRNDLEAPATLLAPSINIALQNLTTEGAEISRMSGSGATCFGIFPTKQDAARAAAAIARRYPAWFVVPTLTFASDEVF